MEKICMTEEVPEREARAYDTMKGKTIFITQRDGQFYPNSRKTSGFSPRI